MNQTTEIRIDETAKDVRSGFRQVCEHLSRIESLLTRLIERLDEKRSAVIPLSSNATITQLPPLAETLKEAVGLERERCCKDICPRCQAEEGLRRTPDGVWAHVPFAFEVTEQGTMVEPEGIPCDAAAVRERAWKEENAKL